MLKYLQFAIFFVWELINRHKRYVFLGGISGFFFALLLLQVFPFYKQIVGLPQRQVGYIGRFNTVRNLPLSIQNQISRGLTALTPSRVATPSLSLSWEVEPNGLSYTFFLAKEIFWHDGSRLTAKDINYRLKDVSFTPLNETTLRITLKDPYAPLPIVLSQPLFKSDLLGLGDYKIARIKYKDEIISELDLLPLKKDLAPLKYKFYPSENEALLGFKLGEVNILENLSQAQVETLATWKNIKITETNQYDKFVGVFFNLKNPLFKEKEVRQALNYATPKFEKFEEAYTPISPLSWAYSSKIRLYRFDPEVAKKILSKSLVASPSTQLTISTYVSLLETAQIISEAWKKVGVNSRVKVENSFPPDYHVFVLTLAIPPDPDQYQYWQSTQETTNFTHYSNLKIDKLLEDGRRTLDQDKRRKIYADFQRYLVDDSPAIFLYYPKIYTVERK